MALSEPEENQCEFSNDGNDVGNTRIFPNGTESHNVDKNLKQLNLDPAKSQAPSHPKVIYIGTLY